MNSIFKRPLPAFSVALTMSMATLWSGSSAATDIASAPLFTSTTTVVKPNVMFILDDSGSMGLDYLPDAAGDFARDAIYNNEGTAVLGYRHYYGQRTSQCNGVAFNPDPVKGAYLPPLDANGASFANADLSVLDGNDTNTLGWRKSVTPATPAVIGSGSLSVNVSDLARTSSWYPVGSVATVYSTSGTTKYMVGKVTSWNVGTGDLVISVVYSYGSGSLSAARVGSGSPADNVYYTYSGTQTGMDYRYPGGVTDKSSTFWKECGSELGVAPGSGVFTAVIVRPTSTEAQRYANWHKYYRTRMAMMKAAVSHAFKPMDDKFRIGFSTIHDKGFTDGSEFLNIRDFNAAQKTTFYTTMHATVAGGSTPLRGALTKAGRYYAKKLKDQNYDPIQYSCQKNFTILSTDGYWNTGDEDKANGFYAYKLDGSTEVGNQDGGATPRPMYDGQLVTVVTTEKWDQISTVDKTTTTPSTATKVTTVVKDTRTPTQGQTRSLYTQKLSTKKNIENIVRCGGGGGGSCTITVTLTGHGYNTGDTITIAGANPTAHNGARVITKVDDNTFTYVLSSRPSSASAYGNSTYQPDGCAVGAGKESTQVQTRDLRAVEIVTTKTTEATPSVTTQVTHQKTTTKMTRTITTVNGVVSSDSTSPGTATPSTVNDPATTATGATSTTVEPSTATSTDDTGWVDSGAPTKASSCTTTLTPTSPTTNLPSPTTATKVTTTTNTSNSTSTGTATVTTAAPVITIANFTSTSTSPDAKGGTTNSLADIAMYYYLTDLRDKTQGNCTGSLGKDVCANDVTAFGKDKATYQHMTTFGLSLGNNGVLQYDPNYETQATGDFRDVIDGKKNWPTPPNLNGGTEGPANIDDLWHAAVNGRGRYFSATDPASLAASLNAALSSIAAVTASSSAAATSTLQPVQGDNGVYIALFRTAEWTGDLRAYEMNIDTGEVETSRIDGNGNRVDTASWSAADKLTTAYARKIYYPTGSPSALTAFEYSGMSAADKALFDKACDKAEKLSQCAGLVGGALDSVNSGANMVSFLRGQPQAQYRTRAKVLGDIVNSSPVYVGRPALDYASSSYTEYKAATRNRKPTIYVGANDGMLHAFDAKDGTERWAYIPRIVMPNLYKLADQFYESKHLYFVDAAPAVGDIHNGSEWRTILVGGLGGGGRGYFALDITDPEAPKALWEFNDARMGLSFGNPIITKNKAGKWVVAVTSGYNNGGDGYLFMLDAVTGQVITGGDIKVAGSDGLSKLNAWIDSPTDNTVMRFYSGDVNGNLYRITPDTGKVVNLAHLNIAGKSQPITTMPQLAEVEANGSRFPVVYVGTGRYLGKVDIDSTDQQSVYAIKDPLTDTGYGENVRDTLVKEPVDIAVSPRVVGGEVVDWSTKNGWYFDLGSKQERVNVDPQLAFDTLTVAGNIPGSAATDCTAAGNGTSWLYQVNIKTGKGRSVALDTMTVGLVTVQLPDENKKVTQASGSGGGITTVPNPPSDASSGTARRTSWRELID